MTHQPQIKIPATYMRGGTSKGVFFRLKDLPEACQTPCEARDKLLLRVIGSPDPYQKQIDGMGGATSSTSKTVILADPTQPDHDVDYLFGQVSIDKPFVDWSGNCGNLTAAVGAFAINSGFVAKERIPENGTCTVRIWQANIQKTIVAHVPITNGEVQETGDFELDGVTFPAAEVQVEFMDPADGEGSMFPTGNLVDDLEVPGVGTLKATMINAGIPTIFVNAEDIGYKGTELQDDINSDPQSPGKVRNHPGPRRNENGADPEYRGSGQPPAHAESRLRGEAFGLRILKRQEHRGRGRRRSGSRALHGQATSRHDGDCCSGYCNRFGGSWNPGEPGCGRWRPNPCDLRASLRHIARWRGSEGSGWPMDRNQSHYEPQCAGFDGRLGAGAWR